MLIFLSLMFNFIKHLYFDMLNLYHAFRIYSNINYIENMINRKDKMTERIFFSIWVFFHEHSRFTRQQGKVEAISLTPLYYFHPLHRHLDISRVIAAESSPLHIASSWTRTGNLWFPSTSR